MSESFEDALAILQAYLIDHKWGGRMANRLKTAHEHELEQARKAEYSRDYEDGRISKDADHAAVALRLSRLKFDGGSHENLSKIAYAIYPCATGWTCESSKGLRDRLIDLLGGVHEHRCDAGRDCARGDSRACGVGEHAKTVTAYDALGNERYEAVCKLRKLRERDVKIWNIEISIALGLDLDASNDNVCDRLIYLLGGDAPVMDEGPSDG